LYGLFKTGLDSKFLKNISSVCIWDLCH